MKKRRMIGIFILGMFVVGGNLELLKSQAGRVTKTMDQVKKPAVSQGNPPTPVPVISGSSKPAAIPSPLPDPVTQKKSKKPKPKPKPETHPVPLPTPANR